MSQDYMTRRDLLRFEYPVLVTLAAVGMMIMVSAGDLIALYMGLELQSLALYVVAALRRDSAKSTEAGLKYFVLGALSSGLLLYGASLTYGYAGTTAVRRASCPPCRTACRSGLLFGLVFMLAGLAFKVSAAPFHMWTPDVYEGSPTPVTAFFATAPKVAAMALFARLVQDAFGGVPGQWGQVLAGLAVASMFLGAVAAIGQRDIKRLMAYSSIAHMGFALMGSGRRHGVRRAGDADLHGDLCDDERRHLRLHPVDGAGRPPGHRHRRAEPVRQEGTAEGAGACWSCCSAWPACRRWSGFFGKFYVLKAAVDAGLVWLAVAGVIASVIGAFYYLRIVYFMYFGGRAGRARQPHGAGALGVAGGRRPR